MWAVRKMPLHQHRLPCQIRPMDSLARRLLQAASAERHPVRNIICARHLQLSSLDCNLWKASQRRYMQNRERSHIFFTTLQRTFTGLRLVYKLRYAPRLELTHTPTPFQEPLARVAFAAHPTCHDVNHSTASHEHLDIIIGFQTGDLIWFGESVLTKPSGYCTSQSHDRRPDRTKIRATE